MTVITLTRIPTIDGDRAAFLHTLRAVIAAHLGVDVHHTNTWPTPRLRIDTDQASAAEACGLYLDGAGIEWEVTS